MASDTQRLVVSLEAKISQFEKALNKATGVANKRSRQIEDRFAAMNSKVGGLAKSFGVGLVSGMTAALAPAALLAKALRDIDEAAALQRLADRVGIGTESLQALQYAAAQVGINLDQMGEGLGDFTGKLAEAAAGAGPLYELFKANNVELKDQNGQLRSTRDLLFEFADLIKNAQTPAEQLYLAQQAFGEEAAKLVPIFKDGARGLQQLEANARAAGAVVDADLIKRAAELDKRMESMWATFSARSKSALLTALAGVDTLLAKIREYEERRAAAERASDAGAWVGGMVKPKGEAITPGKSDRATTLDARMAGVLATELSEADLKLVEALRERYAAAAEQATVIPMSGGSSGGSKKKDTFKPDRDAFAEMIGATEEWRRQQELANQTLEEFGNIAQSAGASLASALVDGKLEGEELLSILGQVAQQLLSMVNIGGGGGSGGIGGILTSLLGGFLGGFSSGGYTGPGGKHQPAGVVHKGEVVFSQDDVRRHGGARRVDRMRRGLPGYGLGGIVGLAAGGLEKGTPPFAGGLAGFALAAAMGDNPLNAAKNNLLPRAAWFDLLPGFADGGVVGPASKIGAAMPSAVPAFAIPQISAIPRAGAAAPAGTGSTERSVVEIQLSPEVEARVLKQAGQQSIAIVKQATPGITRGSVQATAQAQRNRPGLFR